MSTHENVHLTILRQRILKRRQNSPVKCQPRKCAPTANSGTQLTALCTRTTFCTRWSKPVSAFWLQNWEFCTGRFPIMTPIMTPFLHARNQCLAQPSSSCCYPFDFNFRLPKKCTRVRMYPKSQLMRNPHRRRWCNFLISSNTSVLFAFSPKFSLNFPCHSTHKNKN